MEQEKHKKPRRKCSDIVEVVESDEIESGLYFCDSIGFKTVDFEPEKAGYIKEE